MEVARKKRWWEVPPTAAAVGLFFLLLFLHLWLLIDPRLVCHSVGITTHYYPFSFHSGWPFLRQHLVRPGGFTEYVTRFITQFFCFGWVGALIVTAVAWSLSACTAFMSGCAGRARCDFFRYVPAISLLVMYGAYAHPLGPALSILAGLLGFALYVRVAPNSAARRLPVLVLACATLYQVAGAASLLFPIMVGVYELLVARRTALSLVAWLAALAIPWIMGRLFGLDPLSPYWDLVIFDAGAGAGRWSYALAVFFPILLAASAAWSALANRRPSRPPDRRSRKPAPAPTRSPGNRLAWQWRWSGLLSTGTAYLAAGAAAWISFDALARTVREIDYYSEKEEWPAVLESATRLSRQRYDVRSHRNIMLALYHSGQLADRMFHYPQPPADDLYRTPEKLRDVGTYFQESRLFLELGLVNMAEKAAYEALETCGDLPAVLEELAVINLVKGRPETASTILGALAEHPLCRRAAREVLGRVEADPSQESDIRVACIRRNMLDQDSVSRKLTAEDLLLALLAKNPHNRMAFEFLMAYVLVDARPERIAAGLERLKDFSYSKTPRHFQEAMAVCAYVTGIPLTIPGHAVDPEVRDRLSAFLEILARAPSRETAIRNALAAGFGDSYFFYFKFRMSGL